MRFSVAGPGSVLAVVLTLAATAAPANADAGTGGLSATAPVSAAQAAPAPATPAAPAPASPALASLSSTISVSLTRSQTKSVQRRVHVRPDGSIGARTRVALRRYQGKKHLTRTGRPNLETLHAMRLKFAAKIERRMRARAIASSDGTSTFPILGRWHYGKHGTGFGDRGGSHQGIDLLSACGTPLVAASSGTVKANTSQARAGNYLVVTDTFDGRDQAYMHLKARSPLKVGTAVTVGDPIGEVGRTGNASACHLHFELWSSPGWYSGGRPIDPSAQLSAWAAQAP